MATTITTFAGGGTSGCYVQPVPCRELRLKHPSGVAVEVDGSVLVADSNAHAIRRVRPDGSVVTLVGDGAPGYAGDGGPGVSARLHGPTAAIPDGHGSMLIADRDNDAIRAVRPTGTIETIAGGRGLGYAGDGQAAVEARISRPRALVLDAEGGLWFTDRDNHAVRRLAPDGTIDTVAGGRHGYSGDGGDARLGSLARPRGLGFDGRGHLFVTDRNNHAIREIDLDGRVTTFAGGNGAGYSGDGGDRRQAQFEFVSGIVFDVEGVAYVSVHLNHAIRRIDPDGRIDTVVGGHGVGYSGDGGEARDCQLSYPSGLAIDDEGNLYIADRNNDVVRVVSGLCAAPVPAPSDFPRFGPLPEPATPRVHPPRSSAKRSTWQRVRRRLSA